MSYSIQPTDYVDKLELNHADHNKVIIHDSDVQDIINMMQEDLQLEKFKPQNDENLTNDLDVTRSQSSIKSAERNEYRSENTLEEMSLNGIDSNNMNSNSDCNSSPIRDDSNEHNFYELNEPRVSLNEERLDENETYNKNKEEEEEEEEEEAENHYIEVEAFKCQKIQKNEEKEEEENNQDKNLNEFIEKAKDFNANALDLSRKNIFKIPRKLLELNLLQVELLFSLFYSFKLYFIRPS